MEDRVNIISNTIVTSLRQSTEGLFTTVERVITAPDLELVLRSQLDAIFVSEPDEDPKVYSDQSVVVTLDFDIYLVIEEWNDDESGIARLREKVKIVRDTINITLNQLNAEQQIFTEAHLGRIPQPKQRYPINLYTIPTRVTYDGTVYE